MRKLLFTATLLAASPAFAGLWTVDTAQSSLTFEGKQQEETFSGSFRTFTPEIDFDEAAPEKGHIKVAIDIGSATIDGKERSEALPTDDWLGAKKFPTATFTSSSITKTATHQYAATGTLALHGMSKQVTLPFTLTKETNATRAEGKFTLKRNEYKIGSGRWESTEWVADPVTVHYIILANPK